MTTATPKAADLASELDVELDAIEGSGHGGKVTVSDVREHARSAEFGEPPDDLNSRGRRIWFDVKGYLKENELWKPVFGELLADYCRSVVGALDARARIAEVGSTTVGSQGQVVAHPEVKIRRDYELDALRYATALLITPEAVQKHQGLGDGDEPDEGLGF